MRFKFYIIQWMDVCRCLVGLCRNASVLLCFLALGFLPLGCAKVDLVDLWMVQGHLVIAPDAGAHTLPALTYHFYNANGKSELITASCDGRGNYAGNLPMGIYRGIAVCPNAQHVELKDMDRCEEATVSVAPVEVSSLTGETYLSQPGDIYVVSMDYFVVNPQDTAYHTPVPVLLTKRLHITILMSDALKHDITHISGTLRGVCASAHLFSCLPEFPSSDALFALPLTFSPSAVSDEAIDTQPLSAEGALSAWEVTPSLLGIRNPEYGEAYVNLLTLTVRSEIWDTEELEADLTTVLSDAIADNNGRLPLQTPLTITLSRSNIGLVAAVTPWQDSGNGGGYVPKPVLGIMNYEFVLNRRIEDRRSQ